MKKFYQPSLFEHVALAYAGREEMSNNLLYKVASSLAGIDQNDLEEKTSIGNSMQEHSTAKRAIRWEQQTLKRLGLLERVDGKKGVWRLTNEGKKKYEVFHQINDGYKMLAFSSRLGLAFWADARAVFMDIDEPVTLCLSSPPYPLRNPRAYGNPSQDDFVDWICYMLEPIVKLLKPGGSIVLNVSNDVFIPGMPARSIYREVMVVEFARRFGLYKMDEIPWVNTSKAPGPVQWASKTRQQLNVAWEPIYIFSNDPKRWDADNRRILQPHTEKHKQWVESGGGDKMKTKSNCDGAYKKYPGAFSSLNPDGKIAKNVYTRGHKCSSQNAYKIRCAEIGIPAHGAPFPLDMAKHFIQYLSSEDDLIAELFGGSMTTPLAAEKLGRRWIATDIMWEYLRGGGERFPEIEFNKDFLSAIA